MRILSLHFPRMDIHRQVRQQIIQVFRCLRCRAGSSVSFLREDQVYYREKEGQEYYKGQSLGELKKRDQIRNEYYEKFTGIRRDDPHYYDMVINVSKTGVAGAASLILDYIRNKEEEKGGNAS